jgi:hypothetical protein
MKEPDGDSGVSVRPRRGFSRLTKALLWLGLGLVVLVLLGGAIAAILLHRAEPLLRSSLVDTLQKRFHARVELDDLHVSILDGFWVEGQGLRIWLPQEAVHAVEAQDAQAGHPGAVAPALKQPWIVVQKLRFHAGWIVNPLEPIVVSVIHVQGVEVRLPPPGDRPHMGGSEDTASDQDGMSAGDAARTGQHQLEQASRANQNGNTSHSGFFHMPPIEIKRVECEDAVLDIERKQQPDKPVKVPLVFQFQKVIVIPDGRGGPMAFDVQMTNAKPVGIIHSTGHAGPWTPGDPGALPVEGNYSFDHADLSTIKGIAGILSSTGHYQGTLRKIEAEGDTQTLDFRLERVEMNAGVSLTTHFEATIDGTSGDTWLHLVDAMLGRTHIVAKGEVVRAEDAEGNKHGHNIQLQVNIDRGRIEDILHIAADANQPFMIGNLTLDTSFNLPAGDEKVIDKLQLDGEFHLSQVRFSSEKMQGRIEDLSLRGQGKPDELKTASPKDVLSEMQGHFKMGDGVLQLPDLEYQVPGAQIDVQGKYGMQGGTLDFTGDAKLKATVSEVVGGWKGFLLKPVDGWLKKNGAGTDVPIKLSGTKKDPKFGVEFGRLGKNDEKQVSEGPGGK